MQKYQPCLKITCETSGEVQQCTFPECRFIAVTSYQNSQVRLNLSCTWRAEFKLYLEGTLN